MTAGRGLVAKQPLTVTYSPCGYCGPLECWQSATELSVTVSFYTFSCRKHNKPFIVVLFYPEILFQMLQNVYTDCVRQYKCFQFKVLKL